MKRLIFSLFLASLMLAACAEDPATTLPENPDGTLPSVKTEQTPLEILTEAAAMTQNAAYTTEYGRVIDGQGEVLGNHRDFITNENFLTDFCALRLTASPSNTGITRYEIRDLTRDQLYALLYGESTGDLALYISQMVCSAAIEVDTDGYLTRIEYTVNQYRGETLTASETFYLQINIS